MRITAVSGRHRRGLRGRAVLASTAALAAMTAVLGTGSLPAQAALSSRPDTTSPGTISSDSELHAVSAVSPNVAWAVGQYFTHYPAGIGTQTPLIERWNGTAWKMVPGLVRRFHADELALNGVSADSADDAWAVGSYAPNGVNTPLILHWNSKTWTQVKSTVPKHFFDLEAVSAVSANDAWATGEYYPNGTEAPFVLNCASTGCKQVKYAFPRGGVGFNLRGVSAVSSGDAWAVGSYVDTRTGVRVPLVLYCNRTACKPVKSSAPSGALFSVLLGVSADSASDVWVAGQYENSSGLYEPLILHCTSTTACTPAKTPASHSTWTALFGASADSATDTWAAGYDRTPSENYVPLVLHRSGAAWRRVTTPRVPRAATRSEELYGVSASSAAEAWAVGYYGASPLIRTIILRCNGTACKRAPSPNGTM